MRPEIGKRYKIELDPRIRQATRNSDIFQFNVSLQYSFKPDSFKNVQKINMSVNSDSALLSASTASELKVFKGVVASDTKEYVMMFQDEKFKLQPLNMAIHSLKQVRDEKYIGEEAKRLNVSSYLKSLTKKKRPINQKRKLAEISNNSDIGDNLKISELETTIETTNVNNNTVVNKEHILSVQNES